MKLLGQSGASRPSLDKALHPVRLLSRTTFKATGVMEDEAGVTFEDHLILNVVFPALIIIRFR